MELQAPIEVRGRALALLAAAAVLCIAGDAAAESYALAWARSEEAASCPSQSELRTAVRARLPRDPFSEDATRVIEGYVHREGRVFVARIITRDLEGNALGTQTLEDRAESCAALGQAVVLALVVMIDPEAGGEGVAAPITAPLTAPVPAPAPVSAPVTVPTPVAVPVSVPVPVPAPTQVSSPLSASLGFHLDSGLLPRVSFGPRLAFAFDLSLPLRLLVAAAFLPEARRQTATDDFAFGLTFFSVGGCARLLDDTSVRLAVCGTFDIGAIHAVVYRPEPTQPGSLFWSAASFFAEGIVRLFEELHLEMDVGAVLPLNPQRFLVDGRDTPAFEQPTGAFLLHGALALHFR